MPLGAGRCNLNLHFGETKITVILLLCAMAGTRSATVICTANPVVLQNLFTEKKRNVFQGCKLLYSHADSMPVFLNR